MIEERKRESYGNLLVKKIGKEILYQGYVASRLTGLTPGNVRSAISSSNRSKVLIAVPFAALLLIIVFESRLLLQRNPLLFPISVLTWTFIPLFITVLQLSYGASAGPQIREFLMTLPISKEEVNSVSARVIISTISISLLAPAIILMLSSAILNAWVVISGLLAYAFSISLAMIAVSLVIGVYRRMGSTSKISSIIRIGITVPILLLSLSFGYLQTANIKLNDFEMTFLPFLNLAGVAIGKIQAAITAALYLSLISLLGYRSFKRTSLSLLSPLEYFSTKKGRFRIKLRSPGIAIIYSDFRQIVRSPRLAGFIAVPFLYAIVTIVQGFSFHSVKEELGLALQIQFVSNALPIVAISSFLAYVLYLTEVRGFAYLETLPLSKFSNLKGKMIVVLTFYFATISIMSLSFIYLGKAIIIIPMIVMSLSVMASVVYTALYFRYTIRSTMVGALGLFNQAVYTVINLLVFGIPAALYTVGLFLTNSFITPLPLLAISCILELIILLYLLNRAK